MTRSRCIYCGHETDGGRSCVYCRDLMFQEMYWQRSSLNRETTTMGGKK